MVLFMLTLMLLATIAVAPNLLTQGRREKEQEMIWRGKQYPHAIKLYYRKYGKFPTSLDDLTKPGIGNIRFMRQAYKDPMNTKDGEWRLIYVGPTGQLIGSLKPGQKLQLNGAGLPGVPAAQAAAQSTGQPFGQNASGLGAGNLSSVSPFGASANTPTSGFSQQPATGPGGNPTPASTASADSGAVPADSGSQVSDELLNSEPTTVMGGRIIGVGSKINQSSIIIYDRAKNYKLFEFIWDPSKDAITVGGAPGQQIGVPAGQQPGQASPFGQNPNPAGNPNPTGNPNAPNNNPGAPLQPQPGPPETPAPPTQQP